MVTARFRSDEEVVPGVVNNKSVRFYCVADGGVITPWLLLIFVVDDDDVRFKYDIVGLRVHIVPMFRRGRRFFPR